MNIQPRDRFQAYARASERGEVTAVLGPTNTGKTHLAVERMLGHASGMIGLPLRLLAREIYDRVVRDARRGLCGADYGRRKNSARPPILLCLHRRIHAGEHRNRISGGR